MATRRELEYILTLQDQTKRGFDTLEQRIKEVEQGFNRVDRTGNRAGTSITGAFKAIGAAISTAAVADWARDSIRAFADFEREISLVGTLSDEAFDFLPQITERVRELSLESGQSLVDLARAEFDVVSATGNASDSLIGLEQAMRLAVAGGTDVKTTTDGLTTLLNAYSLSVKESARVTNALFEAQQFGKTTVADLASNLGQVAPAARTANVTMEELLGTLGAVTRQLPTNIAATSLAQFFYSIANASDDVIAKSREMAAEAGVTGFEFSKAGVESEGLASFLEKLSRVVGDDSRKLKDLGVATESMKGALVAIQDGAKDATKAIELQTDAVGELGKGYSRMATTATQEIARVTAAWEDVKAQFGKGFFEGVAGGADSAAGGIGKLADASSRAGENVGVMVRQLTALANLDAGEFGKAWLEGIVGFTGDDTREAIRAIGTERSNLSLVDFFFGDGELSEEDRKKIREHVMKVESAARYEASHAKPADDSSAAPVVAPNVAPVVESAADQVQTVVEDSLAELRRMAEDASFEYRRVWLDEQAQELADADKHAEELRQEYAGNAEALALIDAIRNRERQAIHARFIKERDDADRDAAEREADAAQKAGDKLIEDRTSFERQIAQISEDASLARLAARGDEFTQLDAWLRQEELRTERHYDELLAQAEEFGVDSLAIESAREDDLATLREEYQRRRAETERRVVERARRERDDQLRDAIEGDDFGAGFAAQIELIDRSLTAGSAGADLAATSYRGLSDALFDITRNGKSAGEAFKAFGRTVLDELIRIATNRLAIQVLSSVFGIFGGVAGAGAAAAAGAAGSSAGGVAAGSSAGAASGGAMSGILSVAGKGYAKGGIANRPSIFGEAGPEAAVPLPDGRRIPVQLMGGGGGGGVSVTVHQTIAPQMIDTRGADAVLARSAKQVAAIVTDQLDRHEGLRTRVRRAAQGR